MEARRRTAFVAGGLALGARTAPFYAGALHYWRLEPARWGACLAQLRDIGLELVETYVPWRVHEVAPGRHDWAGAKDLARFVEMAGEAGLGVVLRPGPHVNAELTCFGMPDHVVGDAACQARTAHGTPVWMPSPPRAWPVPSYASRAFLERVRGWYAAVAGVVAAHEAVVAIGVDNEAQMFFRLGAYDHDYHPDAITWWNEATGLDGDPPRAWDATDPARCASWVRFKDQYLARALGELTRMLDEVGFAGLARFHNQPPGHYGLGDVRRLQRAIGGPVGIGVDSARADLRELRRRATSQVGNADPVPLAFEVGIGASPWLPPLDAEDDPHRERDQLLSLLAAGIRGFNLAMAVERDRHYGAAISKHGAIESHAMWIRTLLVALTEIDWPALRRARPIALVDTRADARFGIATSVLDPMTSVLAEALDLGPAGAAELGTDAGAVAARRWHAAVAGALELAQIPYAIVDETTPEDELATYRAVIAPTLARVDRGLWQRLRDLAEHKRAIVVIGPDTPTRDELDQPLPDTALRRVGRLKAGSLDDLPGLAADLAALAGDLPDAWQVERPDDVRAFAHADAEGRTRVVFVASDAAKPVTAVLLAGDGATTLRDPFTGEHLAVAAGRVAVPLAARGIRMLVVATG